MIRRFLSTMFAVMAATSLVGNSTGALTQAGSSQSLESVLNDAVIEDQNSWWWHEYKRGSMYNSRILKYSGYKDRYGNLRPSMMLARGEFKYKKKSTFLSDNGYVIIRLNGNDVTCVSYDTGWRSECTLEGGGANYIWSWFKDLVWAAASKWLLARLGF